MNTWDQDSYLKAWNFASTIHLGQTLPGSEIPYINHLGLVCMEALAAIAATPTIKQPNLFIQCALLHDSIEDTETTFADIEHEFGPVVANGVLALTKNKNLASKKEQMVDSIRRVQDQPIEIWMVKLCDRITNLQPPPKHWSTVKILSYRDEASIILNQLGEANHFLADRLLFKIDFYGKYIK
jgi:guanosine-3',5'-bis(diphosphate) 3'-pyrophosphohydrolase